MAISIITKVEKFFNKFENSESYGEMLDGTMGLYPAFFDNFKLTSNLTMDTDVIRGYGDFKTSLEIFVVLKYKEDGKRYSSYKRVAETHVEIGEDMAAYFKASKEAAIKLVKEVMEKGY